MEADGTNLREVWLRVTDALARDHMSISVWYGNGRPAAVDGDTLVLSFAHDHAQARDIAQKQENREIVATLLQQVTENLRQVRTEIDAAPKAASGTPEELPNVPAYQGIDEAVAKKLAEDPFIADVLDVFKGRIASVQNAAALPADGVMDAETDVVDEDADALL
jgi:hypothetical protein